jgi:DNA-directed RNA polymerase sigma subunit (sigma70/sigma32)
VLGPKLTRNDLGDGADELHRRAIAGDTDARNILVEANLKLAGGYASRWSRRFHPMPKEDVVACACRGLLDAASSHDPSRGAPFSVTAEMAMRRAVEDGYADFVRWRTLPRKFVLRPKKYIESLSDPDLKKELESEPPPSPSRFADGEEFDIEGGDHRAAVEARIDAQVAVGWLTGRGRVAVALHYGIGSSRPMDFAEVGREMGVSYNRAGDIVRASVKWLREKHGAAS